MHGSFFFYLVSTTRCPRTTFNVRLFPFWGSSEKGKPLLTMSLYGFKSHVLVGSTMELVHLLLDQTKVGTCKIVECCQFALYCKYFKITMNAEASPNIIVNFLWYMLKLHCRNIGSFLFIFPTSMMFFIFL